MFPLVLPDMVKTSFLKEGQSMELNGIGDFQYLLLRSVVKLDADATPRKIIYVLQEFLCRRLNSTQVYLALGRMTKKGYIISSASAKHRTGKSQIITYSVTQKGLRAIESYTEKLRDLLTF
jgi:DNA-binding PadR family transcriptional regulator